MLLQDRYLKELVISKTFNFSLSDQHQSEQPEERFDQDDGDPYREFGTLPPASAAPEVDPLEQHRVQDIKDCCHRIRGDWSRKLTVRVGQDDETKTNEVIHEEVDEEESGQHDIGVCVFVYA